MRTTNSVLISRPHHRYYRYVLLYGQQKVDVLLMSVAAIKSGGCRFLPLLCTVLCSDAPIYPMGFLVFLSATRYGPEMTNLRRNVEVRHLRCEGTGGSAGTPHIVLLPNAVAGRNTRQFCGMLAALEVAVACARAAVSCVPRMGRLSGAINHSEALFGSQTDLVDFGRGAQKRMSGQKNY